MITEILKGIVGTIGFVIIIGCFMLFMYGLAVLAGHILRKIFP